MSACSLFFSITLASAIKEAKARRGSTGSTLSYSSQIYQVPLHSMPTSRQSLLVGVWLAPLLGSFTFFAFCCCSQNVPKAYGELWIWFRRAVLHQEIQEAPVRIKWYLISQEIPRFSGDLTYAVLAALKHHAKVLSSVIWKSGISSCFPPGNLRQRTRRFGALWSILSARLQLTLGRSPHVRNRWH